MAARNWAPGAYEVFIAAARSAAAVAVYRYKWLPYLAETFRRDQLTGYYWLSEAEAILDHELPHRLDQKYRDDSSKEEWLRSREPTETAPANVSNRLHASQIAQFLMTLFLRYYLWAQ